MNKKFLEDVLKDNWYLLVVLVGVFFSAVFVFFRQSPSSESAVAAASLQAPAVEVTPEPPPVQIVPEETRDQREAKSLIAEYDERVKQDPKHEDAPALLEAAGNLALQKLVDYKEAARRFQLVLMDYPDWNGARRIYIQLVTCYQNLGDTDDEHWVYKQMMEKFPPESQEYLFAKDQLGSS